MTERPKIALGTGAPTRPSRRRAATYAVVCDVNGCDWSRRGIESLELAEELAKEHDRGHAVENGGRS